MVSGSLRKSMAALTVTAAEVAEVQVPPVQEEGEARSREQVERARSGGRRPTTGGGYRVREERGSERETWRWRDGWEGYSQLFLVVTRMRREQLEQVRGVWRVRCTSALPPSSASWREEGEAVSPVARGALRTPPTSHCTSSPRATCGAMGRRWWPVEAESTPSTTTPPSTLHTTLGAGG